MVNAISVTEKTNARVIKHIFGELLLRMSLKFETIWKKLVKIRDYVMTTNF